MRGGPCLWLAAGALMLGLGCSGGEERVAEARAEGPVAIDDQEGAVCGMLLRDQAAPRAQLVHRDGERAFVCSLGDLLAYLAAPSPHGRAELVLVEVLSPGEDPTRVDTGPHEWLVADQAWYVVGFPRKGIMGPPVLAYGDRDTAERVAATAEARVLDFEGLRAWYLTPGH